MFTFMKLNQQPFPNITCSQQDFWLVKPWKRAMLFMFLCRFLLQMDAQKPWNKFLYQDIKFNKRCIQRYLRVDKKIFDHCDEYNELPDVYDKSVKNAPKKRKLMDSASCADSESPVKRSFYVRDSSTDDEWVHDSLGLHKRLWTLYFNPIIVM